MYSYIYSAIFLVLQRGRETGEIYSSGSGSEVEDQERPKKEAKKRLVFKKRHIAMKTLSWKERVQSTNIVSSFHLTGG